MFGFHPSPCPCAWPLRHSRWSSAPFGQGLGPTFGDWLWQPRSEPWWGTSGERVHTTHRPHRQPAWSPLRGQKLWQGCNQRVPKTQASLARLHPVLGWEGKNKKRLEQRTKWQKSLAGAKGNKRMETKEKWGKYRGLGIFSKKKMREKEIRWKG